MPAPRPGRSLFRQFVGPVVGLLAAAVLANVAFSAWLAARRAAAAARVGQAHVTAAIRDVRVALSPQVLDALARLTGSHFVVWDPAARTPGPTTLPAGAIDERRLGVLAADVGGTADIDGVRYRIGSSRPEGIRPETVLVLTPLEDATSLAWKAVWPVLAVAAATLAVLVPLSLRLTRRLAGRITGVERLVARIAGGEFGETLPEPGPDDEIGRLVAGVNRMSATLRSLRDTLVAGERQRLVGQLAAGFAHELRNAVTGAKLSIDLHRRRCPAEGDSDESLRVASRQLDVLEEEVRGLLALGRRRETLPARVDIGMLVADVRELAGPRCDHAGVRMECVAAADACIHGRADALRAALVNLVLNAIDATGRGGMVRLDASRTDRGVRIVVEDDGPGPPEAIRDSLHEPFVTGKPEGIGLGLTIARTVAEEHGGTLEWTRAEGRTRFTMSLPAEAEEAAAVPGVPTP